LWRPTSPKNFQQHVAAEREADRQDAMPRQPWVELVEQGAEVVAAAGVVDAAAGSPGRAGAALVDHEHRVAADQEERGRDGHVAALLAPGETVDQRHQRSVAIDPGQVQRCHQAIAAAVLERHLDPLDRPARQGVTGLDGVVANGLQVPAPPGAPRTEVQRRGRQQPHGVSPMF
jgi:hypothetical protein